MRLILFLFFLQESLAERGHALHQLYIISASPQPALIFDFSTQTVVIVVIRSTLDHDHGD